MAAFRAGALFAGFFGAAFFATGFFAAGFGAAFLTVFAGAAPANGFESAGSAGAGAFVAAFLTCVFAGALGAAFAGAGADLLSRALTCMAPIVVCGCDARGRAIARRRIADGEMKRIARRRRPDARAPCVRGFARWVIRVIECVIGGARVVYWGGFSGRSV